MKREGDDMRDLLAIDAALAAQGVPLCPRCGERDRVAMAGQSLGAGWRVTAPWRERCFGFVAALTPRPGRYVPDF